MVATTILFAAIAGHFAFLIYLTVGGLLALRWPRTAGLHVVAAGWAVAITIVSMLSCPLTAVERWARDRAGWEPLPDTGFIAHYITDVWYPAGWEPVVQTAVAAAVLGSWAVLARRLVQRRRSAQPAAATAPPDLNVI